MKNNQRNSDRPVLIHEVHDLWPKTLTEVGGMSKKNPFVWIMQFGENYSYKNADYVASTLEFAKEHMVQHGLKQEKFRYIANGISKNDWSECMELPKEYSDFFNKLKEEERFVVGYFGGFGLSNALDRLVDTAGKIKNKNVVFVLVGEGNQKQRLMKRALDESIANIHFLDPIPKQAIPSLLPYFDCVYMGIEKPIDIYKFGVSFTKMYDSMMGECPIIMNMSNVTTPVTQFNCGLQCDISNDTAVCDAIESLYQMSKEDRVQLGKNGKSAVLENFEYGNLAKKYEELFPKHSKNVLVINHYAGSLNMGMDFRPFYLAREWTKNGYSVNMIAASYSHIRRKNPNVKNDFQKENVSEITYYWIKTIKYAGNGLKRAITMLQFVGKLWIHAKKIAKDMEPDVIVTSSTYPLDMIAAKRIRKYAMKKKH